MNAEQARAITEKTRTKALDLTNTFSGIERAALEGDSSVKISVYKTPFEKHFDVFKSKLEQLGYTVKRDSSSDMRESYDYAVISW